MKKTRCGVSTYRQRDIALVPFPFSDLSARKVRPVLVLSNDQYNQQSLDVLVCALTTNLAPTPYSVGNISAKCYSHAQKTWLSLWPVRAGSASGKPNGLP